MSATNISAHPLIKEAYELIQHIEKLGASPAHTNASQAACQLMINIGKAVDEGKLTP